MHHQLVDRHIKETALAVGRDYDSVLIITPHQAAKKNQGEDDGHLTRVTSLLTSDSLGLYPNLKSVFYFM